MKAFIRKIWDAIVAWITKIPADKRLHFGAGFLFATFFCVSLGFKPCIIPAIFLGFAKEMYDGWTTGNWDWWDFGATCIGGLVPQIFVLLNLWWF